MVEKLQNIEAERQLLGAMLVYEPAVGWAVDDVRLQPNDFVYLDRHGLTYDAIAELHRADQPCDTLTVTDALATKGELEKVGGSNYLAELAEKVNAPGNAKSHAEIVKRLAVDRARAAIGASLESGQIGAGEAIRELQALETKEKEPAKSRLENAGSYLLDAPERCEAVWGYGDQVLWASGEPFLLTAPQGVGKTTITQQLALARCGVRDPKLLGLPVATDDRPVLYVAADRPEQARRSFSRMISESDREILDARLLIYRGPPPVDVVNDPPSLVRWIESLGAGTVLFDSLKDLAVGLAEDSVGAALNQAIQGVVAAGIEFGGNHHQKKSQDGRKPRSLDDVYGSTWITAGAGSVVLLWGKPGDSYVELTQLKQPDAEVGPLEIRHDHEQGISTVPDPRDLVDMARFGVTVKDAAAELYSTDSPDRNQIERARRKLETLASNGTLARHDPGNGKPVVFSSADGSSVTPRDPQRDPLTKDSRRVTDFTDSASQLVTQGVTQGHGPSGNPSDPLKGAADPNRDAALEVAS